MLVTKLPQYAWIHIERKIILVCKSTGRENKLHMIKIHMVFKITYFVCQQILRRQPWLRWASRPPVTLMESQIHTASKNKNLKTILYALNKTHKLGIALFSAWYIVLSTKPTKKFKKTCSVLIEIYIKIFTVIKSQCNTFARGINVCFSEIF